MKTVEIVGIGTGNPEHVTMQAINALNRADALFIPDKGAGKSELADVRREICRRYVTNAAGIIEYEPPVRDPAIADYKARVDAWHEALATQFAGLLDNVPEGGTGAFLVWGDPGLYDSTIRILERVRAAMPGAFRVSIVPGITSIQALTAAHGIALNRVGEPVQITTGRRLVELGPQGDSVVMLDGQTAFLGQDPELEIFWGAYLGTADEILISGRLGDVAGEIIDTRQAARDQHGWIMDVYLLRERG